MNKGLQITLAPNFCVTFHARMHARFRDGTDWRPPTAEELAYLYPDVFPVDFCLDDAVLMFSLPAHLGERWWGYLASEMLNSADPGFESFADAICKFLAFKGLEVPPGAVCNLLVSKPGQAQLSWPGEKFWGVINLGTDGAYVVLARAETPTQEIRLALGPGVGVRIPDGVIAYGTTEPCEGVDVVLVIRRE